MTKFISTEEYTYWWPVKVRRPDPDPRRAGNTVEQKFNAQFRAIPTDEADALIEEIAALPVAEQKARKNDMLASVVIGWDDSILDEDKQPIPFSAETFNEVLRSSWVVLAFWRAWTEALTGESSRKGN